MLKVTKVLNRALDQNAGNGNPRHLTPGPISMFSFLVTGFPEKFKHLIHAGTSLNPRLSTGSFHSQLGLPVASFILTYPLSCTRPILLKAT